MDEEIKEPGQYDHNNGDSSNESSKNTEFRF